MAKVFFMAICGGKVIKKIIIFHGDLGHLGTWENILKGWMTGGLRPVP